MQSVCNPQDSSAQEIRECYLRFVACCLSLLHFAKLWCVCHSPEALLCFCLSFPVTCSMFQNPCRVFLVALSLFVDSRKPARCCPARIRNLLSTCSYNLTKSLVVTVSLDIIGC